MSVIIRLQNLPWSANALDIRQFFQGLSIPEGGVHIVGGELGDAFIAFSTDEDARQAFNRNGGKIKEIQIKLMLSSRTEMQKVIEAARNPLAAFMQASQPPPAIPPVVLPAVVPAAIPDVKKEDSKEKDRRSRRKSRSRSRDRKDRSRDRRDRRRRDRSRSRSRDRKDRRRRDRSRSRDRTRSKERDRKSKDRKRSEEKTFPGNNANKTGAIGVWEPPPGNIEQPVLLANQQHAVGLLNNLVGTSLEELRRNITAMKPLNALTDKPDFQTNASLLLQNNREPWPARGVPFRQDARLNFQNIQNLKVDDNNLSPHGNKPFNNRMDGNGPQSRQQLGRPMNKFGQNDRSGFQTDRQQNTVQDSCVQIQPFYGGYGEIRRFFQGLFINNTGIKFESDDYGKRTGVAYVRFFYPDDKKIALTKDGGMIRGNIIEVKHVDDNVFDVPDDQGDEDAGQNFRPGRNGRNFNRGPSQTNFTPTPKIFSCLVVEDLPSYAKEQDILKIFGEYPLMSILMVNKPKQHLAYVKFSNSDDAKKALSEKQMQAFDGKPINVRACADEEFESINREQTDDTTNDNDDDVQVVENKEFSIDSTCIDISGLPLKTSDRDVVDFFSDIGVIPERIHLLNSHLGFTGTAYCEFASLEDAAAALEKDGIPLGPKEVAITSIAKEEMESRLGILSKAIPPPIPTHHRLNPNFRPRNNFMPRGHGGMGPRGFMRRFPHQMLPPLQHGNDVGIPGSTILMENVPYKAGLDEILQFFDGFEIAPDNVLRRYNENGTPSGEAKVIFGSHEEAVKAVEQKRFHKIRERTIYLTLC